MYLNSFYYSDLAIYLSKIQIIQNPLHDASVC